MTNRSNQVSALLDKVAHPASMNGAGKNKLKKVQFTWDRKYPFDCIDCSLRQIMSACTSAPIPKSLKDVIIPLALKLHFLVFNFVICFSKALKNKQALFILVCLFHMFSLSAQTPRKDSGADGPNKIKALQVGDILPDEFWATVHNRLQGGDSAEFSFQKEKGKFILLDFWATWCTVCVRGFPKVDSLYQNLKDNATIVLVNEKGNRDTREKITAFFEKYHSRYPYAMDMPQICEDGVLSQYFPHRSIPHYVLISPKGRIVALGSIREFAAMVEILDLTSDKNRTKAIKEGRTK